MMKINDSAEEAQDEINVDLEGNIYQHKMIFF